MTTSSQGPPPFVEGRHYRFLCDFEALRDTFHADEVLVFSHQAYSRYDGITGYFFIDSVTRHPRVLDIYDDDEDPARWAGIIEETAAP